MRWAALLILVGCTSDDPVPDPADSEDTVVGETDTIVPDTELVPDTDDTDPPPPVCSPELPDGPCPEPFTCWSGACLIVPADDGPPDAEVGAQWAALSEWIGSHYLMFDGKAVDWAATTAAVAAELAVSESGWWAAWTMSLGVNEISDGHTSLRHPALCATDPGFGERRTDVGACVAEVDGGLWVYRVVEGGPWAVGDELLSIDGRAAGLLVDDRLAQPRCAAFASTPEGHRATAVGGMMRRFGQASVATVRRAGAKVELAMPESVLETVCDGRMALVGEEDVGGGVLKVDLPDGALFHIPQMGFAVGFDFLDTPVIDALRTEFLRLPEGTPIILDVRGNRGGHPSIVAELANWFLPPDTEWRRCLSRFGDGPDDLTPMVVERTRDTGWGMTGPLVVLQDSSTYGSAEFLPWWTYLSGRGQLVGQPSDGSYGLSWQVPVPGVGGIINALRCERADGSILDGSPPAPDVVVTFDPADLAAGVDTMVEAGRAAWDL